MAAATLRTIRISFASLNEDTVTKTIKAGTKLEEFAESIGLETSELFVNGKETPASYVLRANDTVVATVNAEGGC